MCKALAPRIETIYSSGLMKDPDAITPVVIEVDNNIGRDCREGVVIKAKCFETGAIITCQAIACADPDKPFLILYNTGNESLRQPIVYRKAVTCMVLRKNRSAHYSQKKLQHQWRHSR